ncbi:MAG: long-chain fatty acid--CoA ligase [Pseudomonadota bacterium]|nr:long-chain fatty acid--CoA ligase [Pseudomonadota bacterium]
MNRTPPAETDGHDPDPGLVIRTDPDIGGTLCSLFWARVQQWSDEIIIRDKHLGVWRSLTWHDLGQRAMEVALALNACGFKAGDIACILSNTNKEWLFADLGILCSGGVSTGIYPTDAPAQVEYLINNCQASVIFVEDEEQLDKVLLARSNCPSIRKIVIFDTVGLQAFSDPMAVSLADFSDQGRQLAQSGSSRWSEMLQSPTPDDLAVLIYTSGTTGPPKGAMISHHNVVFQCVNGCSLLDQKQGDERLAFLPLCHVAERIIGAYYSLYTGTVINFCEGPDTVVENVREVQPTVFGGVPRVWEKFYSGIQIAIAEGTAFQKWACAMALNVAFRVVDLNLAHEPVPWILRAQYQLASMLVLKNIRKSMGLDRCRWMLTGAAPVSPQLVRWYLALGLQLLEIYGQTENVGMATVTYPGDVKLGTVGRPVPYGELKISHDGEILLRGDHVFMGYYNMPEKTAEVINGGWLHTGDVGRIDEQGYVSITDRMKDIIITAGGKNVTPSEIENELKFSPYVSDAVIIGDGRKYLTSLVMVDHDNVAKFAQDQDVPFTNFASLCRAPEVVDLIRGEIDRVNETFARVEQIKDFRLIDVLLTPEDDELTPTMKLKRSFVSKKYKDVVEEMYN